MLDWDNGGFSVDASVRIADHGRPGLEWLLRYCVQPPFAPEGLERRDEQHVIYRLPKPQCHGRTGLSVATLELIDDRTAPIQPPHRSEMK